MSRTHAGIDVHATVLASFATPQDLKKDYQIAFDPDYAIPQLHKASGKIFMVVNLEWEFPSSQYVCFLKQNKKTGALKAETCEPVDWSAWWGIMAPCGGSPTTWGSSIAGEEQTQDGRTWEALSSNPATVLSTTSSSVQAGVNAALYGRYFGLYNFSAAADASMVSSLQAKGYKDLSFASWKSVYDPYHYG